MNAPRRFGITTFVFAVLLGMFGCSGQSATDGTPPVPPPVPPSGASSTAGATLQLTPAHAHK